MFMVFNNKLIVKKRNFFYFDCMCFICLGYVFFFSRMLPYRVNVYSWWPSVCMARHPEITKVCNSFIVKHCNYKFWSCIGFIILYVVKLIGLNFDFLKFPMNWSVSWVLIFIFYWGGGDLICTDMPYQIYFYHWLWMREMIEPFHTAIVSTFDSCILNLVGFWCNLH